jgi:hypothetical protein
MYNMFGLLLQPAACSAEHCCPVWGGEAADMSAGRRLGMLGQPDTSKTLYVLQSSVTPSCCQCCSPAENQQEDEQNFSSSVRQNRTSGSALFVAFEYLMW